MHRRIDYERVAANLRTLELGAPRVATPPASSSTPAGKPFRGHLTVKLKRAYEPPSSNDGVRVLVERLWPRGISKERLKLDGWIRDVGPTTELRQWFHHDPEKWEQFRRRYFRELDSKPAAWQLIIDLARRRTVTLVYSSHDEEHNNAVALREYLLTKAARRVRPGPSPKGHRSRAALR